jgi:hypothetical protein
VPVLPNPVCCSGPERAPSDITRVSGSSRLELACNHESLELRGKFKSPLWMHARLSPVAPLNRQLVLPTPERTTIGVPDESAWIFVHCTPGASGSASFCAAALKGRGRTDHGIREVETYDHGVSTAVFAGAGAGVGILVIKGVSAGMGFGGWAKGSVYAGGAGIGAVLFGTIGYFAHPIHHTIYKAQ